ncbi:GNAT family acetyltransferase [Sphingomonas aracearum]|uniref:GNAT family acetyltransferase n=1 Tax=Sphingomonas aracearum TaxID=2283317 RepID=A0A369VWG1_9SPHN|nr:GNAT family acetyltransferase [Sphingomonas aracearum]RDE05510.1 GNAT family acetyltransferase [Sphingomonas aracearum]
MIRAAMPGDRAAVVALWQRCGLTRPWNDPFADFDRARAGGAVLMTADGAGAVMVGDDGHRGWIYYLAVAAERRGEGIGRALMTAAEEWLRARGCPKVQLMVREDNATALGFYAALGLERQAVVTLGRFLD